MNRILYIVITLTIVLSACQTDSTKAGRIVAGSSQAEVSKLLGEPDHRQEFILPEVPFFGPQEGLIDLIPAGTPVEEWVYIQGDQELYIWFTGEENRSRNDWKVIDTGRYPVGAVY